VSIISRKLTPEERRELVARGFGAGKSNRAIARELDVDEGTVRRDRKYLAIPVEQRLEKKVPTKKPKKIEPAYAPDDTASLEVHAGRMLKALKDWIVEEHILITEIEDVLHSASKHLYVHRESLRNRVPVPTRKPKNLFPSVRPTPLSSDEIIPNPDFWARWLARWFAVGLPGQEELQARILREASIWARSEYPGSVY
jgi:transposase-like protein